MKHKQNGGGGYLFKQEGSGDCVQYFGIFEKMLREAQGGIIIDQLSSMDIKEGTLKNMGGGVVWLCQNIFMDLKKCWEGYAKIFYGGLKLFGGLKNVWGVCQQILCMDLKKKIGGGVVMHKYFIDLKKCWGGYAAACQNILGI